MTESDTNEAQDPGQVPGDPSLDPEAYFSEPVSGASYGWFTKALATGLTAVAGVFALVLLFQAEEAGSPMILLICGGALAMAWTTYFIVTGRTTIDADGIRQDWFTGTKNYSWDDVRKVSMFRLPMATRLVINTGRPPYKAVHSGSPEVTAAFAAIVSIYKKRAANVGSLHD
jgi:hypothetical protein